MSSSVSDEAVISTPYDVVFVNGTLIDGTGAPGRRADVAVRGERIVLVGDLREGWTSRHVVDVGGMVVAPGFIDVHTHDDAVLIDRPTMVPKVTQGVTTVIAGNCGISAAPYDCEEDPDGLLRLVFKSERFISISFAAYVDKVRHARPAVNCGFLTGHTTLRLQVMGDDLRRTATADEISSMAALLDQALEEGSLGLSTGLFYEPARSASTEEVVGVGRGLRERDGVYATHMRDEGHRVLESVVETLTIGRELGASVVISHHKCIGRENFGRSVETLAAVSQAVATGHDVALDVYPYTASSTVLNEEFAGLASRTMITWCDRRPEFRGMDLDRIADELGCSPLDAIPLLQPAGAIYFVMDEGDVERILSFPLTMVGSDGLPDDEHPHPRLWGTFPRVLGRYVRERNVLTLEEAVHRMTGLSARNFRIPERGVLAEGNFADVCVFDPGRVLDRATYDDPVLTSVGIEHVMVNGRFVLTGGEPTGERPGRVLLRARRL